MCCLNFHKSRNNTVSAMIDNFTQGNICYNPDIPIYIIGHAQSKFVRTLFHQKSAMQNTCDTSSAHCLANVPTLLPK